MLTLLTPGNAHPLDVDDYYIRQLDTGYDQLKFEIDIWDPEYKELLEEAQLREESEALAPAIYLVKAVDGGKETAAIVCELDLDEWKADLMVDYKSESATVAAIVSSVAPAGWTVDDQSGLSYQRTIELEAATPLEVLEAARSTFTGISFRWDNINRIVRIVYPDTVQPVGVFVTRDLNLKENNYKGKSSSFATRLYAYGKDGLSFASINNGLPYVDNNTYSNKTICAYWSDERYTVAENLLADAKAKLAGMAIPERSYSCDVYDLARTNPEKYGFLSFQLYAVVGLIDQARQNTVIYHQVVELDIYPYLPQKNKVVLSTRPQKIQNQLKNLTTAVTSPISQWSLSQSAAQGTAIENATSLITGNQGGYVLIGLNENGQPYEILIMDTPDKTTAQKVWRWNQGGLGYSSTGYNGSYDLAMTQDGAIVADFITVGALSSNQVTVGGFTLSISALYNGMQSLYDSAMGVYLGLDGIALGGGNFRVTKDGLLYAKEGTFAGNVYANNIQTDAQVPGAGYIQGYQVGAGTISGGYSGNIGGGTITTTNTSGGINTSLGYANFSNDVFNGVDSAYYGYFQNLIIGNNITFGGYTMLPRTLQVTTPSGPRTIQFIGNIY